jgi:hypothetical protein
MFHYKRTIKFFLFVCCTYINVANAQIKLGDNPTEIDANSLLELESANQGLLFPRILLTSTTSANPLTAHIAGMTVYNLSSQNDVLPGLYYNDGTKWVKLNSNAFGNLTSPAYIGTSPVNTLSITGLQDGDAELDEIVSIDPNTGQLKKLPISSLTASKQKVYIASSGQRQFTTPMPISDIDKINVYRNGVRIAITQVGPTTIEVEPEATAFLGDEIRIVQSK